MTLRKIKAVALAEALGMGRTTIHEVLAGRREVTLGELIAMVEVFDLRSIEELIAPLGTSQLRRNEYEMDVV